jgi:hypothetical protein
VLGGKRRSGGLPRAAVGMERNAVGRGRCGGPRGGARGRPDGGRDGGDPGRPRTARADRVPHAVGPRRRRASACEYPGHPPCSQSTTSTPSSLACEPAARSSLARWSATETAIGSATSAARSGHRRAGGADRLRAPAGRQPPRERQWSSRGRIPQRHGLRAPIGLAPVPFHLREPCQLACARPVRREGRSKVRASDRREARRVRSGLVSIWCHWLLGPPGLVWARVRDRGQTREWTRGVTGATR